MLLGPQGFEQVGDPAVDRPQSVQARVAGAAEGDQGVRAMGGPAVMDDQRRRGVTDAAGAAVAGEDPFPAPAEAGAGAAAAVVAGLAQPAAVELGVAAGAAQRELYFLAGSHVGGPGLVRQIVCDKKHYHRGFQGGMQGFFRGLRDLSSSLPRHPIRRRRAWGILPSMGRSPRGRLVRAGRRGFDSPAARAHANPCRGPPPFFKKPAPRPKIPMSEDERHEMLRTVDEAHSGLKELVLRLRRHTPKSPAHKAAVKAEQEIYRLRRELQRLTLEDLE